VANLIAAGEAVTEHWKALTPDLKGKIVDELMVVTVLPSPRGTKGFHPEYVDIKPKGGQQ
jgi:site-specific DNA recombinase